MAVRLSLPLEHDDFFQLTVELLAVQQYTQQYSQPPAHAPAPPAGQPVPLASPQLQVVARATRTHLPRPPSFALQLAK